MDNELSHFAWDWEVPQDTKLSVWKTRTVPGQTILFFPYSLFSQNPWMTPQCLWCENPNYLSKIPDFTGYGPCLVFLVLLLFFFFFWLVLTSGKILQQTSFVSWLFHMSMLFLQPGMPSSFSSSGEGISREKSTSDSLIMLRRLTSLIMLKPLTVWITANRGKFLEMVIPDHLTASWETFMHVKKHQFKSDMDSNQTGSKLGKE